MEELEQPQPPKRPANRKVPVKPSEAKNKTVTVSEEAFYQAEQSAKKLRLSKSKYTSAAIAYFATNGLDPTKAGVSELAQLRTLLGETNYEVRKHNADIGNRLVAILRTWEANQYKFLQQQQVGLLDYLEDIETNILTQLVALEAQVLAPMLERLVRGSVETHMSRIMTEILLLRSKEGKFTTEELRNSTAEYDGQLDRRLVAEMRQVLEKATIAVPKATQKPALITPVVGVPAKPTSPTTPPTTPKV